MRQFATAAGIATALWLTSGFSRAEEPHWSADLRPGWTILGPSQHATGGLTVSASGRYTGAIGEKWGLHAGAQAAAVGIDTSWHWVGLLAGPEAGAWLRVWQVRGELTAALPMGQLPISSELGIRLRYWVASPGGSLRLQWQPSDGFAFGADAQCLYVRSLPWNGVGCTFGGSGRVAW